MHRSLANIAAALGALLLIGPTAPAAGAGHSDNGRLTHGVGYFSVAYDYPCAGVPGQDEAAPVLCFPKPAGTTGWSVPHVNEEPCSGSFTVLGLYAKGDCLYWLDAGHHVKVFGGDSLGNVLRQVTIVWRH